MIDSLLACLLAHELSGVQLERRDSGELMANHDEHVPRRVKHERGWGKGGGELKIYLDAMSLRIG